MSSCATNHKSNATEHCQHDFEEDVGQRIQELAQRLSEVGRELQGVTARELPLAKKNQLLIVGWQIMEVVEPGFHDKMIQAISTLRSL